MPGNNQGVMIKIKKPQGGGTVRNIPIRDYQASIAANFGTLRKSVLPQQQFESLVSEPEKGRRLASKTKQRVTLIPRVQKTNLKMTQKAEISHNENVVPDTLHSRQRESAEEQKLDSPNKYLRDTRNDLENYVRTRPSEKDPVDLQRGHVVQKISVYEGNSREPKPRSFETCKRRQLGVPLVGMHNACGLPVVAPWPTQVNITPREASGRIVATLRPIPKIPLAVPNGKSRTHPKRRAPQHPSQSIAFRSPKKFAPKFHRVSVSRDSNVGVIPFPDDSRSLKKHSKSQRRPSFKVNKMNTFPSRHSRDSSLDRSARTTFRSVKGEAKRKSPVLGTFGRRSLRRGSAKRKTLYAKDVGDEAAKVLSTLCLNPLARSKEATNMIW